MRDGGVVPLVYVVCEHVVGVINEDAMARMLGDDDFYVCYACLEREEMAQRKAELFGAALSVDGAQVQPHCYPLRGVNYEDDTGGADSTSPYL